MALEACSLLRMIRFVAKAIAMLGVLLVPL